MKFVIKNYDLEDFVSILLKNNYKVLLERIDNEFTEIEARKI